MRTSGWCSAWRTRSPVSDHYILGPDGRTPVPVSMMEWATQFRRETRRVGDDTINVPGGLGIRVSTVFLGLDHSFDRRGPPILFETMIFHSKEYEDYCVRCATWDLAEVQHLVAVKMVEMDLIKKRDGK